MDKALTPYIKGGGAQRYEEELKKLYGFEEMGNVGGFQAMTQDMLTVLNDIPFTIPPYFALLARAVVTLEGIALIGDPEYKLIMEAYPFVARKLLSEDRPAVQQALQEVLYSGASSGVQGARLAVLLNSAMGVVARQSGSVFVDFDSIPEDGISFSDSLKFLLSPKATSLRNLLEDELINIVDILIRQATRKAFNRATSSIPSPLFSFLPKAEDIPGPFLIPSTTGGSLDPILCTPKEFVDTAAPKLTRDEELYALSLKDLADSSVGSDVGSVISGDILSEPDAVARLLLGLLATGQAPIVTENPQLAELAERIRAQLTPLQSATARNAEEDGRFKDAANIFADLDADERLVLQDFIDIVVASMYERTTSRVRALA